VTGALGFKLVAAATISAETPSPRVDADLMLSMFFGFGWQRR